jgi:hypothetical protein
VKDRVRNFTFDRGLQRPGQERPDDFQVFQNVEHDGGGGVEARKGMVRLGRITNSLGIMDADGTNDRVNFPSHAALVPLGTVWTLETLFQADSLAADCFILGPQGASAAGITIKATTTETVVVTVTDSAATAVTLTFTGVPVSTVCGLQVVRSGASLSGWLNGTTVTASMHATNVLASGTYSAFTNNGGDWMNGGIDYLRIWKAARTTQQDIYRRLLNPRNRNVLFDWVFNEGSQSDVMDRGIYNAHGVSVGSPTWARTNLAVNPAPIVGMAYNVRRDGTKELVAATHGKFFNASVS